MADETPGQGQQVPQAQTVIRPPATAAEARPAESGTELSPRERAAALRREAAAIEAGLGAEPGTTRVKVEPPHSEIRFGGVAVGNEFVPVNNHQLADLQAAAEASGVKLTIE